MKKHWITALGLLVAGCSGGADEAEDNVDRIALVKLAPVEQAALAPQVAVFGAAEPGPAGKLTLAAPAEAVVVSISAPIGTPVARGQPVARLAPSPATRIDFAKAISEAQTADAGFARARRLRSDGLASNADVETARAAARAADATRAGMAARAGALTLRAPAAGVVDAVAPGIGDVVQPGASVASISRISDVRVRFGVDPVTARSLRAGMRLHIAGNAARAPLDVPIQSINPVVDPQTKLAALFATVPNGSAISVGETLTATIDTGASLATPDVPYTALLDDGGQPYVYVVARGVAHRRNVVPGAISGGRIAVTNGLRPGEYVIVEGGTGVEDGMKVRTH
jgi:membrane fusion protein, multidrug efflux system